MSDRCRLVIEVRVDEVGLFEEHLDGFDEIREEGNTAECIIDEASGTMECEIRELALKHNLTFCGWHEEGAEWNPGLFAACGGFVVWVDSNIEKIVPVIELQPDLRIIWWRWSRGCFRLPDRCSSARNEEVDHI